jgi:hypothetical protein
MGNQQVEILLLVRGGTQCFLGRVFGMDVCGNAGCVAPNGTESDGGGRFGRDSG